MAAAGEWVAKERLHLPIRGLLSAPVAVLGLLAVAGLAVLYPLLAAGTNGTPTIVWVVPVAVLASAMLLQATSGVFTIRRPTIATVWYISYLVQLLLPGMLVFNAHPGPYRYSFLAAVTAGIVLVPFGMLIANILFHFHPKEIGEYFARPVVAERAGSSSTQIWLFCFIVAAMLTGYYFTEVQQVPLLYAIQHPGEYAQLSQLREDSLKLLQTRFRYIYIGLRGVGFPILVTLAFGYYLSFRTRSWLAIFLVSLGIAFIYTTSSIEKLPAVFLVATLTLYYYMYRMGKVEKWVLALCGVIAFAFPTFVIAIQYYGQQSGSFSNAVTGTYGRTTYGPADALYTYFEYIPAQHDYLHGGSIGKLAFVFGLPYYDISNATSLYHDPRQASGSNNAAFLGYMYADFGWYGIILGSLLVGAFIQWCEIYIVRRSKTQVSLACYVFVVLRFSFVNASAFPTLLLSEGILFAMLLVALSSRHRGAATPELTNEAGGLASPGNGRPVRDVSWASASGAANVIKSSHVAPQRRGATVNIDSQSVAAVRGANGSRHTSPD